MPPVKTQYERLFKTPLNVRIDLKSSSFMITFIKTKAIIGTWTIINATPVS